MTQPPPAADQPPEEPSSRDPFAGQGWGQGAEQIGKSSEVSSASTSSGGAERVRRRVRVKKKIHRRRRRIIRYSCIGLGALVLLSVGWILYTGLSARSQLETVRDDVHKLRTQIDSGDLDGARATADEIGTHASKAHDLTSDPLWGLASDIPYLGKPVDSARIIASSVNDIAEHSLPSLIDASKSIDPKLLRGADGSINLAPLAAAGPTLDQAVKSLDAALARINHAPKSTWLGVVDTGRRNAITELKPLTKTITQADLAVDTLPTLLGQSGTKTYMVAFENEAELRGTGGLAGAFAIVSADHGKISFDKFEPDDTLINVTTGLNLGTDFAQTYNAADVTGDYRDANTSPNFPYAAQIWSAEWKKVSGQSLDGVLALDPTALSYFLKVTGPAKLPAGSVVPSVSSSNVVELTQQKAYADFGKKEKSQRKVFLLDVAKASALRLASRTGNTTALVRAAGRAASEHRLLFWSADAAIESRIAGTAISGVTPITSAPYAQVAINNAGGNKLDYYTHVAMTWSAAGCGATRRVTVTFTVSNDAPTGLSKYVLGNTGQPGFPQVPGDNQLQIGYYATAGSRLTGVLINSDQGAAGSGLERGHPVFTVNLPLPRGATQTVTLNLTESGTGTPILRLQPMVNPMTAKVTAASC